MEDKSPINKYKKFTVAELEFIKNNYPQKGAIYCANELGRSVDGLTKKAAELGVSFESVHYKIDWVGKRFGRYIVLKRDLERSKGIDSPYWVCQCDCGNIKSVQASNLRTGEIKSCGCHQRDRMAKINYIHGMSDSPTWKSWNSMIERCYTNIEKYKNYYGRNIRVCQRWRISFSNFFEDLGIRPKSMTLDRIDNNQNYSCGKCEECLKNGWKFNCRWATLKTQGRNKRNTVFIEYNGIKKPLADLAEELNIPYKVFYERVIKRKWSIERASTTKIQKRRSNIISH